MPENSVDFLDSDFRVLLSGNLPIRNSIDLVVVLCDNNTPYTLEPPDNSRGVYISAQISKDVRAYCLIFGSGDEKFQTCLLNGNNCFFLGDFNTLSNITISFFDYGSNQPASLYLSYF